ncbi:hypothetical protein CTI12_AA308000 [Artemisia annua]|uniref:AB hydrolase-1 domain-containing protein n=1 Tax=Artemisia annua TaxID=35608 RepID=A0A2U1N4X2_ARTAN|nr:hypothetical protein CTI12_AA308000 [Artemisia annua]
MELYSTGQFVTGVDVSAGPKEMREERRQTSYSRPARNIPTLAQTSTVYAINLLGSGASDKPVGFEYTMEAWAQLISDFLNEVVQSPTVLIGNSVGSLACVIAAADAQNSLVRGLVMLNCVGGMNNKAIVDDWRIKLRALETSYYQFMEIKTVDDDLVEIIREPTLAEGALDAFVSIVTGPPGPNLVQ